MAKAELRIATVRSPFSRRAFLKAAGMGVMAAGVASCAPRPGGAGTGDLTGPVDALVFGGYDHQGIARIFQERYGIAVNFTAFNDNEEAYTRIKAGGLDQYDIIQADSFYFRKYYDEGLIEVLDYGDFESASTLFPEFADIEIWREGDGYLAYPSMWAPYPIVYNPEYVDPAPTSWASLFDPRYAGRVSLLDRPVEPIVMVAIWKGYRDPYDLSAAELREIEAILIEQKPLVRTYWRDVEMLHNLLASGEVWISMAFGPGAAAEVRARGTSCEAIIAQEGCQGWIDGSAIVKGARDREAAIKWIDTQYSPEGYMILTQDMPWGVPNQRAVELLIEDGKQDFVSATMSDLPETIDTLYHYRPPSDMQAYVDTWNRVLAA
jgi:putative spermidine/putrescine transport system substrate-binding protein/spermidine/putrescine transport system substrate-binding protein